MLYNEPHKTKEIKPKSKTHKLVLLWLKQNKHGWKEGPRKWKSPYLLSNNNFSLHFSNNFAIVKITKNHMKFHYSKEIDNYLVNKVIGK